MKVSVLREEWCFDCVTRLTVPPPRTMPEIV